MASSFDSTAKLTTAQRRAQQLDAFEKTTNNLREMQGARIRTHSEKICDVDYLSDCALAAKRSLSPACYQLWRASYLDFEVPEMRIPARLQNLIKQLCGKAFMFRHLVNTRRYFHVKEERNGTNTQVSSPPNSDDGQQENIFATVSVMD